MFTNIKSKLITIYVTNTRRKGIHKMARKSKYANPNVFAIPQLLHKIYSFTLEAMREAHVLRNKYWCIYGDKIKCAQ